VAVGPGGLGGPAVTAGPVRFPTVAATTLAGRPVTFPDAVVGQVGLLFVAFRQRAQADINTWVTPLIGTYLDSADVAYYEIPMISGGYRWVSGWIDGGMRGGVPGDLHDRTATYYGPRATFYAEMNIGDRSRPYLFVLDRAGRVVHRADGPATPAAVADVEAAIASAVGRGSGAGSSG
jgi:hypothetical protein